jgi:hypothetical protein
MSIRSSIRTAAITAILMLSHSAIATAEVYKTSTGQVIVTDLTAKQSYPIQVVNAKNKGKKLKDKVANTCGEVTVDNAAKYKSLVVGTETIDPATLSTKVHPNCTKAKKAPMTPATTPPTGIPTPAATPAPSK